MAHQKTSSKKPTVGSISKYLPEPKPEGVLIQARVSPELAESLRKKLKTEGVFIAEFMEAAIRAYLEE